MGLSQTTLGVLMAVALIPPCAAAQVDVARACTSADVVLARYVDAIGGKAVFDIQSQRIKARESNPGTYGGGTEHYVYQFKWKAPNRVVAERKPYVLNVLPASYPNSVFIFDGTAWSNFERRMSRNEDRDPEWQRVLRHKFPYNESPHFLMLRVVADPLMIARASELYTSFQADRNYGVHPGLCVLRANGQDEWRGQREDVLYFDATTGFLRTWRIQAGPLPHKTYVNFEFADYRQVGAIRFPFQVYFDYYKAAFRYTEVVHNKPLPDSDFVAKPAKP